MSVRARVQIGSLTAVLVACGRPAPATELSSGTAGARGGGAIASGTAPAGGLSPGTVSTAGELSSGTAAVSAGGLSPGTGAAAASGPAAAGAEREPAAGQLSSGTAAADAPRPEAASQGELSPGTAEADGPEIADAPRSEAASQRKLSPGPAELDGPEDPRTPVSLPRGRWESPSVHGRVCLELLTGGVAVLTFFDDESEGWKPVRVTGKLRASNRGDEAVLVAFKVESVERKGVSVCRKHVVDKKLARTRQLGATWRPGASVEFTLAFSEYQRGVRLCVPHADGAPSCRELRRVVQ